MNIFFASSTGLNVTIHTCKITHKAEIYTEFHGDFTTIIEKRKGNVVLQLNNNPMPTSSYRMSQIGTLNTEGSIHTSGDFDTMIKDILSDHKNQSVLFGTKE